MNFYNYTGVKIPEPPKVITSNAIDVDVTQPIWTDVYEYCIDWKKMSLKQKLKNQRKLDISSNVKQRKRLKELRKLKSK